MITSALQVSANGSQPQATLRGGNANRRACPLLVFRVEILSKPQRLIPGLALIWPVTTAAFLASLVEAVEALTIVLAVATVRGWRPAGLGALAGIACWP